MAGFLEDTAVEEVDSLAGNWSSCTLPFRYNCYTIGLGQHAALEEQHAVPGPAGSSLPRSL